MLFDAASIPQRGLQPVDSLALESGNEKAEE